MCGGFTCSKNTLVGLNVIYILVSFLMIGVAVHGKVSGIVTSLPIVGGITACGIFLLIISVIGLIGTIRHHQVLLFFYMVVLFLIFVIQFSCSCAALAIDEKDEQKLIQTAWTAAEDKSTSLIVQAEQTFDCCGLGIDGNGSLYEKPTQKDMEWTLGHKVFTEDKYKNYNCYHSNNTTVPKDCFTCYSTIRSQVNSGFNTAGGLGLFFSFTELVGGIVACRYRNLMDPFAIPSSTPLSGGGA
jgi:tetraspanin-13/31